MEGKLNLVAQLQQIASAEGAWSNDALAVDKGAVGAAQIFDDVLGARPGDASVPARHPCILYLNVALGLAANHHWRSAEGEAPSSAGAEGNGQGG